MTDDTAEQTITEALRQAQQAAERAGLPHHIAAGEKLLEAESQMRQDEFGPWVKRNLRISQKRARQYMAAAKAFAEFAERHLGKPDKSRI